MSVSSARQSSITENGRYRNMSAAAGKRVEASGGTEVTSGGYKYHTFTSSDTFTVTQPGNIEILVIGGGGGGGNGSNVSDRHSGGGGAGAVMLETVFFEAGDYPVIVAAGAGQITQGNTSYIGGQSAEGGGYGGAWNNSGRSGTRGASGGGPGGYGTGSLPGGYWGHRSGNAFGSGSNGGVGGAGGGAGEPGEDRTSRPSGKGGDGVQLAEWATATSTGVNGGYYGGGGQPQNRGGYTGYALGRAASVTQGSADPNTGGGGSSQANGGSGLVIARYSV